MVTIVVKTEHDLIDAVGVIKARKRPFTLDIVKGERRSDRQNRLQRLWLNEASEQLGDHSAEELRGICKLQFGVPILRAENTAFAEAYDLHVRPLPYEQKVALMMEPIDLPVTRIMTTDQKTRFLEAMCQHFLEQGVVLTEPMRRQAVAA